MIEESPVGGHQSNGEVERAIQSVQELMTMKLALQSRYKSGIPADHPILPLLVKHAAMIPNLCKVGHYGRISENTARIRGVCVVAEAAVGREREIGIQMGQRRVCRSSGAIRRNLRHE